MADRALPYSRVNAERRVLSPDEKWAAGICERIIADCHPFQRDAVEDPSRRLSILAGRFGAKTTTMRARAVIKMVTRRRAELLYVATTEPWARDLNWEPLQEMNEHYGLELRFNKSELTATCARTGSRYVMGGAEDDADIDRYRGKTRTEVQIDETASHDPARLAKLTERVVGPRTQCITIGGSPGHRLKGMFYDATRPGSPDHARYADRNKPGYEPRYWSSHWWNAKMVTELPNARELYPEIVRLWNDALVEKAAKGWSDDNPVWMREYLGLWAADDTDMVFRYCPHKPDGTPWNQWDPFGDHKLEGVQALKASIAKLHEMGLRDLCFVYGEDMGHTDPFALNIFAFSPSDRTRGFWHVMPFERTGMTPRQVAELHVGEHPEQFPDPPGGLMAVTGWPDAMGMDADPATIATFKDEYGLPFVKASREANYKQGEIALVNGDFHEGRIRIIKGSPLEDQLQQLQWAEDQFGKVKENRAQANHSTDTLIQARKLIANLFDSGSVEASSEPADPTEPAARTAAPAAKPQGEITSQSPDDDEGMAARGEETGLLGEGYDDGYTDIWGNGI